MSEPNKTYLALGDSMSIDLYTGVRGGGAVNQFYTWLKWRDASWQLVDRSVDMCRIPYVPTSLTGDIITLTIGGNDLLANHQQYLSEGFEAFTNSHFDLLTKLRTTNPSALLIVGNVYSPQVLPDQLREPLDHANAIIAANIAKVGAVLADIRETFRGHEQEYLCYDIEPSVQGAGIIASLFKQAVLNASDGL